MKGFDTKALILFPNESTYIRKPAAYKYQFRQAVTNLVEYLKSVDIEPHVFFTDDIARTLNLPDFKWVSTLSTADRFFISKYCDGTASALQTEMIEFPDVYNAITAKDPGSLDLSVEQRFALVTRHDLKAIGTIVPKYRIVIHFMVKNKTRYKVTSKPDDNRIRIIVNAATFIPTAYIGGLEENAIDLFGVSYGNRALDNWEVLKKGGE